ncbi:plasmid pRiA4b ORF-3 family protein [Dermacoccus nishinomiyaensis]|uniref:plasmid pRiA4b ORF-3 family protein n=1 Tax=Dermacoccus nishinomiyaensis TaxID=1274 RepID=UPI001F511CCC|nr:plasmid pRiA4b ORF-3 family protein [Dermacoccus nishinomiyaensis]
MRLLTVRVDVDEVEPAVWRRFEVRSDGTMAQFHDVLPGGARLGGRAPAPLHARPKKDIWGGPYLASEWDVEEGDDFDEASGVETEVVLDQVLRAPGDRVFYVYDFGDDGVHTIKLEKVVELAASGAPDADGLLAECVAGRNACPLED